MVEQAPTTETPTYDNLGIQTLHQGGIVGRRKPMVRAGQWPAMTSFAIHEDLVKEGFDRNSDEYYTEVDKRIEDEFPTILMKTHP